MVNGSAHAKFSSSDVEHVLQEEDNQIQTEEKHHAISMRYVTVLSCVPTSIDLSFANCMQESNLPSQIFVRVLPYLGSPLEERLWPTGAVKPLCYEHEDFQRHLFRSVRLRSTVWTCLRGQLPLSLALAVCEFHAAREAGDISSDIIES